MSDEGKAGEDASGAREGAGPRSARFGDGFRQGIGVLTAFKDAIEETIQEARDRGDLSADRAREVMKEALDKAHSAAGEARERLDFVSQGDFEALRARVAALEVHVFGDARGGDEKGAPGSPE